MIPTADNKKERILQAALQLFTERGFHGTPTSAISKEAGIAAGTLFTYFPSKDDLVLALYIHAKQSFATYLQANHPGQLDTKQTIRYYFLSYVLWSRDNPLAFRFIELFSGSPYAATLPLEVSQQYIQPYLVLISQAIEEGIIKALDPELVHQLVQSHTQGISIYLLSHPMTDAALHAFLSDSFDMLMRMLQ